MSFCFKPAIRGLNGSEGHAIPSFVLACDELVANFLLIVDEGLLFLDVLLFTFRQVLFVNSGQLFGNCCLALLEVGLMVLRVGVAGNDSVQVVLKGEGRGYWWQVLMF